MPVKNSTGDLKVYGRNAAAAFAVGYLAKAADLPFLEASDSAVFWGGVAAVISVLATSYWLNSTNVVAPSKSKSPPNPITDHGQR